jgi:DNA-binding NarL/FixJ family response regulator
VLPRPSMRPAFLVLVVPLPAHIRSGGSAFAALVPAGDQAAAVVSIVDPDGARSAAGLGPILRSYLRVQYALTDAEVSVALDILAGDGLEAVAVRRGVTMATVKTQARRVYEKAGVRGQLGLAQLVARLRVPVDLRAPSEK